MRFDWKVNLSNEHLNVRKIFLSSLQKERIDHFTLDMKFACSFAGANLNFTLINHVTLHTKFKWSVFGLSSNFYFKSVCWGFTLLGLLSVLKLHAGPLLCRDSS